MVLAQLCPKKGCGAHLRLNETVLNHGDDVRCPGSHEALKYCGHCNKVCARNSWHRHGGEHSARKGGRPRKEAAKGESGTSSRSSKSKRERASRGGQTVKAERERTADVREDMRAPDDAMEVREGMPKSPARQDRAFSAGPATAAAAAAAADTLAFGGPSYNAPSKPKFDGFGPGPAAPAFPGPAPMGVDAFGVDPFGAHRPSVEDFPLDLLDGPRQSFSKVEADMLFSGESWDFAEPGRRDSALSMGSLSDFPQWEGRRISDVDGFEGAMEGMEMEMSMPSGLLDGADWADAPPTF